MLAYTKHSAECVQYTFRASARLRYVTEVLLESLTTHNFAPASCCNRRL